MSNPDDNRIRLTSIAGTLASAAIVVAFFLPWVAVPPEQAERFRELMYDRIQDPLQPLPAGVSADDWRGLADLAAEQGHVSGLDVFYWARTARRTAIALAAPEGTVQGAPAAARAVLVVAVVLAVLPIAAALLCIYYLVHRWQRAASPALVLAILTGTVAATIPAVHSILSPALGFEAQPESGMALLLPAGALLALSAAFGVRLRNWWRVLAGALLVGGGVALFAWGYVASAA